MKKGGIIKKKSTLESFNPEDEARGEILIKPKIMKKKKEKSKWGKESYKTGKQIAELKDEYEITSFEIDLGLSDLKGLEPEEILAARPILKKFKIEFERIEKKQRKKSKK